MNEQLDKAILDLEEAYNSVWIHRDHWIRHEKRDEWTNLCLQTIDILNSLRKYVR